MSKNTSNKTMPPPLPEPAATEHQYRLNVFVFEGIPFMKVIPVKRLFNSTMVHEVVTRGDFFAVNLTNNALTVLPQGANIVTKVMEKAPAVNMH